MNVVMLAGRLTRDPEIRLLPSGQAHTAFALATSDYRGGEEEVEHHAVVCAGRLAEVCGQYLAKGQHVAVTGRLHTRAWEDDRKARHYRTEVVAVQVEMLSGRRMADYAAEVANGTGR